MDRLGSRCPLPGYLRPSVLICLLILAASFLSYPVLRTLSLQLHSAITGSYVSGTYSIVFVNCPNEQIARDIARSREEARVLPQEAGGATGMLHGGHFGLPLLLLTTLCVHYAAVSLGRACGEVQNGCKDTQRCLQYQKQCQPDTYRTKAEDGDRIKWVLDRKVWKPLTEPILLLAILDKKLAASVNILPKASSLYFWNGEIEEATEILLLIKTKTSKVRMLFSYIRLVHPFEIPEVFSLPMDQGDARYLKWLEEGTGED